MTKKFSANGYPKNPDDLFYAQPSQSDADLDAEHGYLDYSKKGSKFDSYKQCYHTHPVLLLGGGKLIGGSCISPVTEDADVYIGLDMGMRVVRSYPWETNIVQVAFPINDMQAPKDAAQFKKLVEWTCNQLQQGKTVHAGCIGGHGRTGTLFAAIFNVLNGDKDATTTVRKLYCKKAVESSVQIDFLHKHFGITKVSGTKSHYGLSGGLSGYGKHGGTSSIISGWPSSGASEIKAKSKSTAFSKAEKVWNSVNSPMKIIGVLL